MIILESWSGYVSLLKKQNRMSCKSTNKIIRIYDTATHTIYATIRMVHLHCRVYELLDWRGRLYPDDVALNQICQANFSLNVESSHLLFTKKKPNLFHDWLSHLIINVVIIRWIEKGHLPTYSPYIFHTLHHSSCKNEALLPLAWILLLQEVWL